MGRIGRLINRWRQGGEHPSVRPTLGQDAQRPDNRRPDAQRPDAQRASVERPAATEGADAERLKVGDGRQRPAPGRRPVAPQHADAGLHHVESDTELADVTIVYSPVLDGDPDPGEVVWTWVQFEDDPTQGKDRPVVIIGRAGADLAGVQLTTKPHPERSDEIPVGSGSWDTSGRVSYAKLERILTIDPHAVRREGAILDKHRFDDVVAALRKFHGVRLR